MSHSMSMALPPVIGFPPGRLPPAPEVAELAERLRRLELTESSDETIMALVVDAEQAALRALAAAPARSPADAAVKLATVLRRVEGDDAPALGAAEVSLLRATLGDLRRLDGGATAGRA
jgi:hypothetical protein